MMKHHKKQNHTPSKRVVQIYNEEPSANPRLKMVILEVIENQIRNNNPPATKQTFERLLATGYTRQQAMELVASALLEEIWNILHEEVPFDQIRFTALLDQLN
jgi:hypothetical protein